MLTCVHISLIPTEVCTVTNRHRADQLRDMPAFINIIIRHSLQLICAWSMDDHVTQLSADTQKR